MFNKILVDFHAEIDIPVSHWGRNLEDKAKEMEYEARELMDFIRDHRSRDRYDINIVREYKMLCSFCGREDERDADGCPCCCGKAMDEWESSKNILKS